MSVTSSVDRFFAVDGARLRYRDEGSGPCVVLIHGWTLDLDMWNPQAADLAQALRVVRWDRRGFGLSSGRASLAADTADCLELFRHLDIKEASVVGMSQGARVALHIAQTAHIAIRSLILDGPPPNEMAASADAESDLPIRRLRACLASAGIEGFRELWARHPLMQLQTSDPQAHALLANMITRYRGSDLQDEAAAPDPGSATRAPPLQPTLIVNGALDALSRRRAGAALARKFPSAQHLTIPEAGHLPNLDNPRVYNAAVQDFLAPHSA